MARDWKRARGLVKGRAKRLAVFDRDEWRCGLCGRRSGEPYTNSRGKPALTSLEVDHIVPRSKGGTNDMDNLQTLCSSCNGRKGARA